MNMNVLTIWEADGSITRIPVPVDAVAIEMARYFREEICLPVMLAEVPDSMEYDEEETERGKLYINEWRNFNEKRLSVVK